MKKNFWYYFICWLIALSAFQVICFVTPAKVGEASKYNASFWIGYIYITIAFIGQLVCAYYAFQAKNQKQMFYRLSSVTLSYAGLLSMLLVGGLFMALPFLPSWVGIILCTLILAFCAISNVKAIAATSIIEKSEQNTKEKTAFIRELEADAEHLINLADENRKAICKKVYEALRYSDPISTPELTEIETRIKDRFSQFSHEVIQNKNQDVTADELIALIDERNKKCKLSK